MRLELAAQDAIFDLPRRKWWIPPTDGPDFSVKFHGQPAGTPVGPAAGPQTQMAQNLVLSWLAGSRILELKTVQINDRLRIARPCIDATNVGYNIEWSQELRIDESLREYVAGAMLIHMLRTGDLVASGTFSRAGETIFDMSVGYDLAGIRSSPVRSFIERMRDARALVEALRGQIPRHEHALRDLDYPTRLSTGITLSTFHGCPADEIERICEFLITQLDCDVVVKMNPPMLGRERLEHLLHDVLGYQELIVNPAAYTSGLSFDEGVLLCRRLAALAVSRGRGFGAKFSNTLEVLNHRRFFPSDQKIMYLSGQPLHVITLALADEFRRAVGPELPLTFSAGVDRQNCANMVACGFCPITTCTDLLRPGGYARLPGYLAELAAQMRRVGASTIDEFIRKARGTAGDDAQRAAAANLASIAREAAADPRYHANQNRAEPKRIDSQLDVFDCITCDKCIPVCPNDANFTYPTDAHTLEFCDYVVRDRELVRSAAREIRVERTMQIANFADFCNECGNCDTFCPEYGGPFIRKPAFYGSQAGWRGSRRDGFQVDAGDATRGASIVGRIKGREFLLVREAWGGYRFEDGAVCLFLREPDFAIERWFAFGPEDVTGHIIDMTAFHTMRILLQSLLDPRRVHAVNVPALARSADRRSQRPRSETTGR